MDAETLFFCIVVWTVVYYRALLDNDHPWSKRDLLPMGNCYLYFGF